MKALPVNLVGLRAHSLADVKIAAVSKLDLAGVRSSPDPNRTPTPIQAVPIKSLSGSAV